MSYLLHLISDNCSTYIVKWLRPYLIWVTESRSRFIVYPDLDSVANRMVWFVNVVECDVIVVCLHWRCWCDVILLLSTAGFASESVLKLDSWILDSQTEWTASLNPDSDLANQIRHKSWGMTNHPIGPHLTLSSGVNHSSLLTVPLPSAINAHPWNEQAANIVTLRLLPITGIAKKHDVCKPKLIIRPASLQRATKAIRELLYGSYAVNIYTY